MTDLNLARAFVALPGWRWMPGMLVLSTNNYHRPARIESLDDDTYGLTVVPGQDGPVFAAHHEYGLAGAFPRGSSVPDLTDPATLGCILALVRERLGAINVDGDPPASAFVLNGKWGVGVMDGGTFAAVVLPCFDTEAEALYHAIKVAGGGA